VRWTVCNLSVCRKVNRQYKHNLSCTVQSPMSIPTDYSPSTFHRELHWKFHNHRRPYRRITVHQHFTESCTGNATITDDCTDGYHPSAFHKEWWKCHNHQWITVRRHFTKSCTGNAIITDVYTNKLQSVGISQRATLDMPQSPTTL